MLGRVARLHYEHGFTHQQIADTLGLSRVKVTRLLAEARRVGVVEIRIHSDESIFTDLEVALRDRYGLQQAWVAPTFEARERLFQSIGTVGATALQAAIHPGMTVAVDLSETVAAVAPHVKVDDASATLFVPATGIRLGSRETVRPQDVAHDLARAFKGQTRQLPAPVLASSEESARLLRQEPDIAATLELARNADIALFGIGGTIPGAGMIMDGTVPQGTIRELVGAGAVGGISAGFYDATGTPVVTSLARRIIGLSLEELLGVPTRIAVAGGPDKHEAILGAIRGGYITVLVTDEATARYLTERIDSEEDAASDEVSTSASGRPGASPSAGGTGQAREPAAGSS